MSSAIQRILVPLDGSRLAEQALPHAATLAKAFQAEVVLLRVLAPERRVMHLGVDSAEWRLRRADAGAYLNGLVSRLQERGVQARCEVSEGYVEEEILEVAQKYELDLLVLTSHGLGGVSRFGIGGTAYKVISRASASVLLVRAGTEGSAAPDDLELDYGRVLVPVDGSHRAEWALHLGAAVARARGSELLIAHVVETPQMPTRKPGSPELAQLVEQVVRANREAGEEYLEEVSSKIAALDLTVRTTLVVAPLVSRALHELVEREAVDLVVVSAHGASGPATWPHGSVAGNMIAYGTTPVLVFQDLPRVAPDESVPELGLAAHTGNGWSR